MKAVLKSESPHSCQLVANRRKTILLSKTCPKLEPPFKGYLYCTKGVDMLFYSKDREDIEWSIPYIDGDRVWTTSTRSLRKYCKIREFNYKIIGEFVCDRIYQYTTTENKEGSTISDEEMEKGSCLTPRELFKYENGGGNSESMFSYFGIYGLHISDLKIYDNPKELGEFFYPECKDAKHCDNCPSYENLGYPYDDRWLTNRFKRVTRPPQSWCYVEEKEL